MEIDFHGGESVRAIDYANNDERREQDITWAASPAAVPLGCCTPSRKERLSSGW